MRDIEEYNDKELEALASNYRRLHKTEGGPHPLDRVLAEQARRRGKDYNGRSITKTILKRVQSSPDQLCSYLELWSEYNPDQTWKGHASLNQARAMLDAATHYCHQNRLPLVTALVVKSEERVQSKQAIKNMYDTALEYGLAGHGSPEHFVKNAAERALQIDLSKLP